MLAQAQHWHPSFYETYKIAIWIGGYWVVSAAISALPAPTAQSKPFYQWFFKFANTIGANLARAYSTQIEKSPNFADAVDLHIQSQQPGKE